MLSADLPGGGVAVPPLLFFRVARANFSFLVFLFSELDYDAYPVDEPASSCLYNAFVIFSFYCALRGVFSCFFIFCVALRGTCLFCIFIFCYVFCPIPIYPDTVFVPCSIEIKAFESKLLVYYLYNVWYR